MSENGICISCGYRISDEKAAFEADNVGEEPFVPAEMDSISVPSVDEVSMELPRKSASCASTPKYEPEPEAEEKRLPPPTNYTHISRPVEETYEEPPKAFEIFVHGFAEEVRKHWWKVLLTAIVPASAFFIGFYYIVKGGGGRRRFVSVDPERVNFKYIFTGILFLVIGTGMTFSGWDPIGLNERLLDLMR